jgi:hypothetical protein
MGGAHRSQFLVFNVVSLAPINVIFHRKQRFIFRSTFHVPKPAIPSYFAPRFMFPNQQYFHISLHVSCFQTSNTLIFRSTFHVPKPAIPCFLKRQLPDVSCSVCGECAYGRHRPKVALLLRTKLLHATVQVGLSRGKHSSLRLRRDHHAHEVAAPGVGQPICLSGSHFAEPVAEFVHSLLYELGMKRISGPEYRNKSAPMRFTLFSNPQTIDETMIMKKKKNITTNTPNYIGNKDTELNSLEAFLHQFHEACRLSTTKSKKWCDCAGKRAKVINLFC